MAGLEPGEVTRHVDGRTSRYAREEAESILERQQLRQASKLACAHWLAQLSSWDLYATFTYDPMWAGYASSGDATVRRPPKEETCERHIAAYVRELSSKLNRLVSAAAAVEYTQQHWPHGHALLSMEGCDPDEFELASRLWYEKHGYVLLARVGQQDTKRVAQYLVKYFTKANSSVLLLGPLGNVARSKQLRFVK